MIGMSGIASRARGEDFRIRLQLLRGRSLQDQVTTTITAPGCALELFDSNREAHPYQEGPLTIAVVGDMYDSARRGTRGEFLKQRYLTNGPLSCTQINGSYLFVIADDNSGEVHIGCDQNAFIPFYYILVDGVLLFSWDVAPLLAQLPGGAKLDAQNLMSWLLVGGRGFQDETRFRGVKRLEPGCVITFDGVRVTKQKGQPFSFTAAPGQQEDELIDQAEATLIEACKRRLPSEPRLIGLSGGLDSRLVLAASARAGVTSGLTAYTYGIPDFVEANIARDVASYFQIPHANITLGQDAYLPFARDGLGYSSGGSIFKHGVQPQLFAELSRQTQSSNILLGCALDLMVGSTHAPPAVYELQDRKALIDFYQQSAQEGDVKNYLRANLPLELFRDLLQCPGDADVFWQGTVRSITHHLEEIPGDHPVDVNDALAMEIRIRRWYNYNLVYPLQTCRLLTPTYDTDFVDVMQRVPWQLRRKSTFRKKLLARLDAGAAAIAHDASMQPASLPAYLAGEFERSVQEVDRLKGRAWFDSGKTVYLPSKRFDANFSEWFRVYHSYQRFAFDTLLGDDAVLVQDLLRRDTVARILNDHIGGRYDYQKFLQLLISAELMARMFIRGDAAPDPSALKHRIDLSEPSVCV